MGENFTQKPRINDDKTTKYLNLKKAQNKVTEHLLTSLFKSLGAGIGALKGVKMKRCGMKRTNLKLNTVKILGARFRIIGQLKTIKTFQNT